MRIAISNLAWGKNEDLPASKLIKRYNIDAVELALGKYFTDLSEVSELEIKQLGNFWCNLGIEIIGLQSLLFGTTGFNIFGNKESKRRLLDYLENLSRFANILNCQRLVFGSPKNRDRSGLTDEQAHEEAAQFFTQLGDIAEKYEVVFCLEPSPRCYGANFLTTSYEMFDFVEKLNHCSIKFQIDTGAILINQESFEDVIEMSKAKIGHIHISEPNLVEIGHSGTKHALFAKIMRKSLLDTSLISIEMLSDNTEASFLKLENSLKFTTRIYRDNA